MKNINVANKEIRIAILCCANGEILSYWYFARTAEPRIASKEMKADEALS